MSIRRDEVRDEMMTTVNDAHGWLNEYFLEKNSYYSINQQIQ